MTQHAADGVRVLRNDLQQDGWLVNAAEAAEKAGVPVGTVWSWASRGKIRPAGYVDGRPLYVLGDVLRTEQATRRAARAKRLLAVAASQCKDDPC